jgi:hypothetical protein
MLSKAGSHRQYAQSADYIFIKLQKALKVFPCDIIITIPRLICFLLKLVDVFYFIKPSKNILTEKGKNNVRTFASH